MNGIQAGKALENPLSLCTTECFPPLRHYYCIINRKGSGPNQRHPGTRRNTLEHMENDKTRNSVVYEVTVTVLHLFRFYNNIFDLGLRPIA